MSWYIHINKAVRKYNKTRQTFYNYINKGYLDTKKVNNKLFILETDIEKVLNDYIPIEWSIVETQDQKNEHNENTEWWTQEMKTGATTNIDVQILLSEFGQKIWEMLHWTENQIMNYTQKSLHTHLQDTSSYLDAKIWWVSRWFLEIDQAMISVQARQKKILFWVYYLVFVGVNIIILRYIS